MQFMKNFALKLGYVSKADSRKEIEEIYQSNEVLRKELADTDGNYKTAAQHLQDREREIEALLTQGIAYQNEIRSLKAQLQAEEQERLAKDATLRQIQNILDRHYKM